MNVDVDKLIQTKEEYELKQGDPIVEPYLYLKNIPSNNQNVRTRFLHAFNELYFHIDNQQLLGLIGEIISIFHESSLLIDDIEDGSLYRRGVPTAHSKYGIPLTINCGNLMYFIALQKAQVDLPELYQKLLVEVIDLDKLKFDTLQILIKEMLNLHHGQGLDIYWRDNLINIKNQLPTIEDYLNMVKNKTGGLFRLSIKLLGLFSTEYNLLIPIANLLGIIYQIRDDYLNVTDENYGNLKGIIGEDLIEGKLSLPILHCLLTTNASPIHDLLYNKTTIERNNPHLLNQCIEYLKKSHSIQFTRQLLHSYHIKVKQLLFETNVEVNNSKLIQIVDRLCDV